MVEIYIDGDGCPVKDEVYRVAKRYGVHVYLVANRFMRTPATPSIALVVVDAGFDAADDWIAERAGEGDVVITADIPLAARCLEEGARVLGTTGREFTEDSIGGALASRALSEHLRQMGVMTGGPSPMGKRDVSRFLSKLDEILVALRKT